MIPYQRIILFKKIPYWIFWTVISLFLFAGGEIGFRYLNHKSFLLTRITLAILIGGLPIFYIFLYNKLKALLDEYESIVADKPDFKTKYSKAKEKIFEFTPVAILVIFIGLIVSSATVFMLGLPSTNNWINIIIFFEFILLLIPAFHGIYIFGSLIFFFRNIQKTKFEVSFCALPTKIISKVENYWWITTLIVIVLYVNMGLFIFKSPYGPRLELIIWLAFIGLLPFSVFISSVFQTHVLIRNIKSNHSELINSLIHKCVGVTQSKLDNENIDNLSKLIEIQKQVITIKEWNFSIERVFIFFITLVTAIGQILLVLDKLQKQTPLVQ